MTEAKVELIGGLVCASLTATATLFAADRSALLLYMAGGGAGGALLGALGGKRMGLLEFGIETVRAKIVANICVLIIFGPLFLDYALETFPNRDAAGVASAAGGILTLFGTSALIMAVPMILSGAGALLARIKWLQPRSQLPEPTPNDSDPKI